MGDASGSGWGSAWQSCTRQNAPSNHVCHRSLLPLAQQRWLLRQEPQWKWDQGEQGLAKTLNNSPQQQGEVCFACEGVLYDQMIKSTLSSCSYHHTHIWGVFRLFSHSTQCNQNPEVPSQHCPISLHNLSSIIYSQFCNEFLVQGQPLGSSFCNLLKLSVLKSGEQQ